MYLYPHPSFNLISQSMGKKLMGYLQSLYLYRVISVLKWTHLHSGLIDSAIYQKIAQWSVGDSNPGPVGYEPTALTSWANAPYMVIFFFPIHHRIGNLFGWSLNPKTLSWLRGVSREVIVSPCPYSSQNLSTPNMEKTLKADRDAEHFYLLQIRILVIC